MSWLTLPRQCLFLNVVKVIKAFCFLSVLKNECWFNCGKKGAFAAAGLVLKWLRRRRQSSSSTNLGVRAADPPAACRGSLRHNTKWND